MLAIVVRLFVLSPRASPGVPGSYFDNLVLFALRPRASLSAPGTNSGAVSTRSAAVVLAVSSILAGYTLRVPVAQSGPVLT